MNTEFPSRLPTIQNTRGRNNTTSSQASTGSEQDTSFRSGLLKIIQNMFDTLDNLSDSVNSFVEKKKTDKQKKPQDETNDKEDKKSNAFINFTKNAMESYRSGLKSLQSTLESTNGRIGSTIGGVFGGGLFSEVLGKVITKSLNMVIPKLLIGVLFSNPILLLIAGAVTLGVIYWREIWDAIKWVGHALDQILDAILHPFSKGKYEEAREGLANEFGVSEDVIKELYGDTVRGRDKMLEDFRKLQEDPAYIKELKESLEPLKYMTYMRERDKQNLDNIMSGNFNMAAGPQSVVKEITQTYIESRIPEETIVPPSVDNFISPPLGSPTIVNTNNSSTYVSNAMGKNFSTLGAPDMFQNNMSVLPKNYLYAQ